MTFSRYLPIGLFFVLVLSCTNRNKHIITLSSNRTISEKLIPPSGCYKAQIIANGFLMCNSKLNLWMDSTKTNSDHIILNSKYEKKEIFMYDWYDNPMQLQLSPDSCIISNFELVVTFFD